MIMSTGSHIMDIICNSPSQGVLDSIPQGRVTVWLPEGLELITPLFKWYLPSGHLPTNSWKFGEVGPKIPLLQ